MLTTTRQALTAILAADPSVTPEHRKAFLETALHTPNAAAHIGRSIRREEAGRLLGMSAKRVDQLARKGILRRVMVPGTTRSIGISESSIRAITEGSAT
jgi:hypothetical protein